MSNFRRAVTVEIQVFTFFDVFAQVAWVGALRLRKVAFKFILKKSSQRFPTLLNWRKCTNSKNHSCYWTWTLAMKQVQVTVHWLDCNAMRPAHQEIWPCMTPQTTCAHGIVWKQATVFNRSVCVCENMRIEPWSFLLTFPMDHNMVGKNCVEMQINEFGLECFLAFGI